MRTRLLIFGLLGVLTLLTGCATKVVVIDSAADVVRLGPDVKGTVYVWQNGAWTKTGKVKLPEGWWAGPGPK